MKKKNIIISLFLILLVILTTSVNAEDEACKVSMSADKTTLENGDTVTITILMSNITKSEGIAQVIRNFRIFRRNI